MGLFLPLSAMLMLGMYSKLLVLPSLAAVSLLKAKILWKTIHLKIEEATRVSTIVSPHFEELLKNLLKRGSVYKQVPKNAENCDLPIV